MIEQFLRMVGDVGLARLPNIKHLSPESAQHWRTESQRLFGAVTNAFALNHGRTP